MQQEYTTTLPGGPPFRCSLGITLLSPDQDEWAGCAGRKGRGTFAAPGPRAPSEGNPDMAVRRIVKFGDPVLATPTALVTDITGEVRDLVRDMIETMIAAPGVGLAANQVGVSLRVAVIDVTAGQEPGHVIILINPQVTLQDGRQVEEEGCLSIPGYTEFVTRPARAAVRALNLEGGELTMEGTELLARAFCHETDHLDGKLFIEKLAGIKRQLITKRVRRAAESGDFDDVYP